MEHNCAFKDGNMNFRYRAAAVIIKDKKVLMVTSEDADYYYSIGGAVHFGEKAEDAVLREVYEEAGIICSVERLLFINENFFREDGFDHHEISLYYLLKQVDSKEIMKKSNSCGYDEYLKWIPIDRLHEYKAYPSFFADKLKKLPETVEHIITDER